MVENSRPSLETKRPARRRWLSLPIAVGLHAVALATFTFASYWHVEGITDPQTAIEPYVVVSLPALPQAKIKLGSPAPVTQKMAAQTPPRTDVVQQPQEAPNKLPTLEPPSMDI